jgi:6-phosphogluconolactonase
VEHKVQVWATPDAVARQAARQVAERARAAVAERGRFTFAVSGGHTPWAMFGALAQEEMPWSDVELFQVDERIAPEGDPSRNLTHLRESIGDAPAATSRSASFTGIG